MPRLRLGPAAVLLVGAAAGLAWAQSSPEGLAAEARSLFEEERYAESLATWEQLIREHRKHATVANGDAHWHLSRCHLRRDEYAEAARALEAYCKAHPKGDGFFRALAGRFDVWREAGEESKAQAAGKRVLKLYPDAKGTFPVLCAYLEQGWKVPRLATSYKVLHYWAFNRVDAEKDPDLRLELVELIEKGYPRASSVRDGGMLFARAWCHQAAGRPAEAISLGEKHLKKHPRASERDKVRFLLGRAYLALDPPRVDGARRHLEALLNSSAVRYRDEAKRLLEAAESGGATVQIREGLPTAAGLGQVAVLTNLAPADPRWKALEPWREARRVETVRFKKRDVGGAREKLTELGSEFVAVAVGPETVDTAFQFALLNLCRTLDADPMPDFHFGYLCARDAADLRAFTKRILEKESVGGTKAGFLGVPKSGGELAPFDFVIHFGHGFPWCIVDGLSGAQIAELELPRAPVIFSGACFNGVMSRSFHSCAGQSVVLKPKEIEPKDLVALGWVRAGATGLIAALEGDRGEMAMAEWEFFKETAAPLGAVVGQQYRLACTSLPETYGGFPSYRVGRTKGMSFYNVMLRGMVSRLLLSDPSYRPLKAPLEDPSTTVETSLREEAWTVTITVGRPASGPFINYLPKKAGAPDQRVYSRVRLPDEIEGRLGRPEVAVTDGSSEVELTRSHVRHEAWGGHRFVNLQVESAGGRLAVPGARVEFTFPFGE